MPDLIDDILTVSGLSAQSQPTWNEPQTVQTDPAREKIRKAKENARRRGVNIDDDTADDFYKVTSLESGRSHYLKNGSVKRGTPTRNGEQAIGFGQIMPSTAKPYQNEGLDPFREMDNIEMSLREFQKGGKDPIERRLAYVGGPKSKALDHYRRTGQVPDWKLYSYIPNNKETYKSYVERSGGFNAQKPLSDDELISGILDKSGLSFQAQNFQASPDVSDDELISHILSNSGLSNPVANQGEVYSKPFGGSIEDARKKGLPSTVPTIDKGALSGQSPNELTDIQSLKDKSVQIGNTDFAANPLSQNVDPSRNPYTIPNVDIPAPPVRAGQLPNQKSADKSNFNVSVSTNEFKAVPPQTAATDAVPKRTNEVLTPRPMIGVDSEAEMLDRGSAVTAQIDVGNKPKGENTGRFMFRRALEQIAPKFGITNAEIEQQLDYEKQNFGAYSHTNDDVTDEQIEAAKQRGENLTVPFSVTNRTINDILNRRNGADINLQKLKGDSIVNPNLQDSLTFDEATSQQGLDKSQRNAIINREENDATEQLRKQFLAQQIARRDPKTLSGLYNLLTKNPLSTIYDAYEALSGTDELKKGILADTENAVNNAIAQNGSARAAVKSQEWVNSGLALERVPKIAGQFGQGAIVDNIAPLLETSGLISNAFDRYVLGNKNAKASDTLGMTAGSSMRKTFAKGWGENDGGLDLQISRGLGQVAGQILGMKGVGNVGKLLTGLEVGTKGNLAIGAVTGLSQQASDAYNTAIKSGATEDQANLAALLAAPGGLLEGASDALILGKLNKLKALEAASPGFGKTLKSVLRDAAEAGFSESILEELPQNLMSSAAAQIAYRKDPVTFKSVIKDIDDALDQSKLAFIIGAVAGGGASAAGNYAEGGFGKEYADENSGSEVIAPNQPIAEPRFTVGEPEVLKTQAEIKVPGTAAGSESSPIGKTVNVQGKGKGVITKEFEKSYVVDFENGSRSPASKKRVEFVEEAEPSEQVSPVPESPRTLEAQEESANNPETQRAGVLYTDGEVEPDSANVIRVGVPEGVLHLNLEKAKTLGIVDENSAKDFVDKNGISPLLGRVENVADTSKGSALVTTDKAGNELNSSIVTSPENAAAQATLDKQNFSNDIEQKIIPAQEAVAERLNQSEKPIARNFRASTNDATLIFDSPVQRDLYDYYANEKKAMKGGGQRAGDTRVKDLSDQRNALAQHLGTPPEKIFDIAKSVSDDVKSQMKGVAHLEERKVVDNVLPKHQESSTVSDDSLIDHILEASGLGNGNVQQVSDNTDVELSTVKPPVENQAQESATEPYQLTRDEFGELHPNLKPFGNEPYQLAGKAGEMSKAERGKDTFKSAEAMEKWVNGKHREIIEEAVQSGKNIPAEVLSDYPDLKTGTQYAAASSLPAHIVEAPHVARMIDDLYSMHEKSIPDLISSAHVSTENGITYANKEAAELMRRARGDNDDVFLGMYLTPNMVNQLNWQFKDLVPHDVPRMEARQQLDKLDKLFRSMSELDPKTYEYKDGVVVVTDENLPKGYSSAVQEELAHKADYRTRNYLPPELSAFKDVDGYTTALQKVFNDYGDISPALAHNEVIAKTFRGDAEDALGVDRQQAKAIRRKYHEILAQQGKTSDIIETEFSPINTQNAKEFIEDARNYEFERSRQNNDTGSEENLNFGTQSNGEIRRGGSRSGNGSSNGQSNLSRQRTGILEDARSRNEQTSRVTSETLFSKPTEAESSVENIAKQTVSNTEKILSYIYDGKRDVSLPESGINLARSGVLMAYSVVRTNLAGNTLNQIAEQSANPFAVLADIFIASRKAKRRSLSFAPQGIISGIAGERGALRKGLKDSYRVMTKGMTDEELKKFDQDDVKEGADPSFIRNTGIVPLDILIEGAKRLSGAVDKPFRAFAEETARYSAAKTTALNNRKAESDWRKTMKELVQNPSGLITEQAKAYGDYATFQDKNSLGAAVEKFRRALIDDEKLAEFAGSEEKAKLLKLITYPLHFTWGIVQPFTTTPLSVWSKNLDYFPPTGAVKAAYQFYQIGKGRQRLEWAEKSGVHRERILRNLDKNKKIENKESYAENLAEIWKAEDAQADAYFTEKEAQQFARVAGHFGLGSTLSSLTILGLLYGLIDIVGSDKDDDDERKKKRREAGILPESIGIGGVRFQVLNQHPAGRTILAVTNLLEQYQRKGNVSQKALAIGNQVRRDLMEGNPYTDALWSDKFKGKDWTETLARKAAMPIPRVVEEIGDVLDESPRKVYGEGVLAPFMHKIPFLREMLPESELTEAERKQRDSVAKRLISTLSPVRFAVQEKPTSTLPTTALGTKKDRFSEARQELIELQKSGKDIGPKLAELRKELSSAEMVKLRTSLKQSDAEFAIKNAATVKGAVDAFKNAPQADQSALVRLLKLKKLNTKSAENRQLLQKTIDEYEKGK